MQKPFNAEGLDLTFLFDAIYPDSSITKVNNVGAAPSAMSGFAPEQTTSLQQLISISISEALEPLLKPLGDFLSAWNTGSQSLPPKSSSTHSIPSEFGHGTQPSISDGSYGQLDSTDFVRSSAPKPVLAKRKANALDEAVASVAKKKCAFGVVGKKSLSTPDLEECSPEMQVKKEPTPGTLLSEFQSSSTEDHASMFLTPAHGQSERQPASSQGKATEDSSAGTESMEEQQHFAHTDAGELSSSREDQVRMFRCTSFLFASKMGSHAIFVKQGSPTLQNRLVLG